MLLNIFRALKRQVHSLVELLLLNWIGVLKIRPLCQNRTVAVVGNSPNLIGQRLGTEIDRYDVVVRINLVQPEGREEDLGSKTDLRVIGATMLERHGDYIKLLPETEVILTSKKNTVFMRRRERRCVYYPACTPRYALNLFKKKYGGEIKVRHVDKRPRTGIVFLSLLMRYGRAAKVTLYGFSLVSDEVNQAIDFAGAGTRTYDAISYQDNHCCPSVEFDLLRQLEKLGAIAIGGDET